MKSQRMNWPSEEQYRVALRRIGKPGGRVIELLQAHSDAPASSATATQLAKTVGYASFSAVNLQYGRFASKLVAEMNFQLGGLIPLSLLASFTKPNEKGDHWILHMRSAFRAALKAERWIL